MQADAHELTAIAVNLQIKHHTSSNHHIITFSPRSKDQQEPANMRNSVKMCKECTALASNEQLAASAALHFDVVSMSFCCCFVLRTPAFLAKSSRSRGGQARKRQRPATSSRRCDELEADEPSDEALGPMGPLALCLSCRFSISLHAFDLYIYIHYTIFRRVSPCVT